MNELKQFNLYIQWHIDQIAQARGYESGAVCVSYWVSSNQSWADDAKAFAPWRDQIWQLTFVAIEPFESGTGELPNIDDFIATLPQIVWPQGD